MPTRSLMLALLLPCLFAAPRASAQTAAEDDWLGRDKALHFSISAGLAGVGYGSGALLFPEPAHARWLTGAGLALSAGLGKEVYDVARGTCFSPKDLAWDVLGTASGLMLSWVVERLLFGPPSPAAPRLVTPEAGRAVIPRVRVGGRL